MNHLEALTYLNTFDIILASKSPRRRHLLKETGLKFTTNDSGDMEEVYPSVLRRHEIPVYLAQAKAAFCSSLLKDKTILITADTIVWLDGEVIGKPEGREDAMNMLRKLSGNMHEVFTGVCIKSAHKEKTFFASTKVFFRKFEEDEIRFYVDTYQPFDKAGAYGIQEWIGYVGVEHIEGSFYNVMGLPLQMLYTELINFV